MCVCVCVVCVVMLVHFTIWGVLHITVMNEPTPRDVPSLLLGENKFPMSYAKSSQQW